MGHIHQQDDVHPVRRQILAESLLNSIHDFCFRDVALIFRGWFVELRLNFWKFVLLLLHRLLHEFWTGFHSVDVRTTAKEAFRLKHVLGPDHEVDIVGLVSRAIVVDAKALVEVFATLKFVWLPEERRDTWCGSHVLKQVGVEVLGSREKKWFLQR